MQMNLKENKKFRKMFIVADLVSLTTIKNNNLREQKYNMGLVTRKPVFRVSNLVVLKQACSATETS